MADAPWLTIIGIGEDGPDGLSLAARQALAQAELVTGAARHLALLLGLECETMVWPVPFADGVPLLLAQRGRRVVMLASGDPFWFGAGSVVTACLEPGEWRAMPAPSSFSLAAARLGWALERTVCLGLHAAPMDRLRPHLVAGGRIISLVRDGAAVAELAAYLTGTGFGPSTLHVLEALGGSRERVRTVAADALDFSDIAHPVAVAIACAGGRDTLPCVPGRADEWFDHDGQISKAPVRALALAALAPRPGETLWDIGAGSGSVGIEWLLAHPANRATAFEGDAERAARIGRNAMALGVDRLAVVIGRAPDALPRDGAPDAVFIGGGLSDALLEALFARLLPGTRVVAHAVTLESEALLARVHGTKGGALLRIELARAAPLGSRRGWRASFPVVQWSVTL